MYVSLRFGLSKRIAITGGEIWSGRERAERGMRSAVCRRLVGKPGGMTPGKYCIGPIFSSSLLNSPLHETHMKSPYWAAGYRCCGIYI